MPVNGNVLKAKGNVLTHVSDIAYPQKSVIRYTLFWFDVMTAFRFVMIVYLFSSNLQVCPLPPDDLKIRKIENIVNSILLMTQSSPFFWSCDISTTLPLYVDILGFSWLKGMQGHLNNYNVLCKNVQTCTTCYMCISD